MKCVKGEMKGSRFVVPASPGLASLQEHETSRQISSAAKFIPGPHPRVDSLPLAVVVSRDGPG